ncbi:hypothetical protein M2152_000466 [Microbacteriaceae bacterium SG_E_30_P1]|uniref:Uncharacterized protein n=1 Tax=Antiquaquibacter oligotrophicus TaxID=2880260 RepID=A0ABT6KJW0_9MICO|nr:hypothetical protein [Antiquaquibacter oligotrophicus]MDH6180284.1 hypothetical protein [Antiquaquibacter oligotrophicus]UDF13969.1 hypothetical protein LH407_03690 [Antiquaquibacter oligotrophicus]
MDDRRDDDEPELAGYEPHERPLRGNRQRAILRVVVLVGLVALILPGIIVTLGTASRTAASACNVYTALYAPSSVSNSARFEFASAAGMGWNCYVTAFDGTETLLAPLGIIPGGVSFPSSPVDNT